MNNEEKDTSLEQKDVPLKGSEPKQKAEDLPATTHSEIAGLSLPISFEGSEIAAERQVTADGLPSASKDDTPRTERLTAGDKPETPSLPQAASDETPSTSNTIDVRDASKEPNQSPESKGSLVAVGELATRKDDVGFPLTAKSLFAVKRHGFFEEQALPVVELTPQITRRHTRREVLTFGIGVAAMAAGAAYLLPKETLKRLGVRREWSPGGKEWLLNNALRVDDDVAEALYSHKRMVPTYTKSQITPIKNNYNGATPDAGYISGWKLTLEGLASGISVSLNIRTLMNRFSIRDQITRFVCVEGWSAIAWWAGLRFGDLIQAYPPNSQAKWARLESSVNLDNSGNPDPYFVSIDLTTARHPQTLLATHHDGQPLTIEHGAPLRLLVPVKLGLKNVKAITRITYSAEEPKDYWEPYGYSSYDGI